MTHPVRLTVTGDLMRSRSTVLLRPLLALPHLAWAAVWTFALVVFLPVQWLRAILSARLGDGAHAFLGLYVRYCVHVVAYACLLAEPWPSFNARAQYALEVEIEDAVTQPRASLLLRPILAVPAATFAFVLIATLAATTVLAWLATLMRGRVPAGMHELASYCLSYETQTWAYLLLLTPRYPTLAWGTSSTAAG